MGRPLALLAGALSLLPALAVGDLARALEGCSLLALAALPWLALAGLPPSGAAGARTWPADLGLALPFLALGAWLDARGGAALPTLLETGAIAVFLFAGLGEASHRAGAGRRDLHALAWLLLVPAAPLLLAALEWVSEGQSPAFAPAAALAAASPLGWAWERMELAAAGGVGRAALGPLPAVLLLVALAGRAGAARRAR